MSKNRLLPNLEDTDAENEWTGMPEFVSSKLGSSRFLLIYHLSKIFYCFN